MTFRPFVVEVDAYELGVGCYVVTTLHRKTQIRSLISLFADCLTHTCVLDTISEYCLGSVCLVIVY